MKIPQRSQKTINAHHALASIGIERISTSPKKNPRSDGPPPSLSLPVRSYGSYKYYPTIIPNEISISLKDRSKKEKPSSIALINRPHDFKPLSSPDERSNFLLPRNKQEIIDLAKSTLAKINSKNYSTYDEFEKVFLKKIPETNSLSEIEKKDSATIACLLSVKSSTRPLSQTSSFPEGFLDCDERFTRRVQVLMRYVFSEEHQKLGPFDMEGSISLGSMIKDSGLATLLKKATIFDLLQIAYPMYMAGDFPIIRPHLISANSKWALDSDGGIPDLMIMSAKRIALEQNIIKADGTYDLEKIKKVNWSKVFNNQGYRAVFNLNVDNLRGPLDALTMALPGIIGIKQGQIRPWDLEGININWSLTNAQGERINSINYIKLLTQAIVRDTGCVSDSSDVNIFKIKQIKNWRERFDKEFNGALYNSDYSVYEAFKLTYPDLCGQTENTIRQSDFKTSWENNDGAARFKVQFAEALYEFLECLKNHGDITDHQARLNTTKDLPTGSLEDEDLDNLRSLTPLTEQEVQELNPQKVKYLIFPDSVKKYLHNIEEDFYLTSESFKNISDAQKQALKTKLKGHVILAFQTKFLKRFPQLSLRTLELNDFTNNDPHKKIITISAKDVQKIKTFLLNNNILWDIWFSFKGLSGGLKAVADGSVDKAFQLLFGKLNKTTGCYGKTDIKPEMVLHTNSAHAASSADATRTLEAHEDNHFQLEQLAFWKREFRNFDIFKADLQQYHNQVRQGVTPDNLLKQLCSILGSCNDLDSKSYLEFLLEQKDLSGKYAFSEKALGVLLNMIDKVLLDRTGLTESTTVSVKSFINDLESWRNTNRSFRSIILDAVKYDRESLNRVTPIGVLNQIIGNLYNLSKKKSF
jgi:hypothetical protein